MPITHTLQHLKCAKGRYLLMKYTSIELGYSMNIKGVTHNDICRKKRKLYFKSVKIQVSILLHFNHSSQMLRAIVEDYSESS